MVWISFSEKCYLVFWQKGMSIQHARGQHLPSPGSASSFSQDISSAGVLSPAAVTTARKVLCSGDFSIGFRVPKPGG